MDDKEQLIDRERPQKLYVQLYEIFKGKIEGGEWPAGSQIPVEEALCRTYEVSKATVRLAISDLVREGYLTRRQGRGTFVSKGFSPDTLTLKATFGEFLLEPSEGMRTSVLAQTVMMPVDDLGAKLSVSGDRHLIYIKRLRSTFEGPVLIQEAFIPYNVCPQLLEEDISGTSLLEVLRRHGVRISGMKAYFDAVYPSADEAASLGVDEGETVVRLEQYFYLGDTPFVYMRSVKKPGTWGYYIEFKGNKAKEK